MNHVLNIVTFQEQSVKVFRAACTVPFSNTPRNLHILLVQCNGLFFWN